MIKELEEKLYKIFEELKAQLDFIRRRLKRLEDTFGTGSGLIVTELDNNPRLVHTTEIQVPNGMLSNPSVGKARLNIPTAAVAMHWSANGSLEYTAHEAMVLTVAFERGTGTLTYTRSLAATPDTFAAISDPFELAIGDTIRVTCASISVRKSLTLKRTA